MVMLRGALRPDQYVLLLHYLMWAAWNGGLSLHILGWRVSGCGHHVVLTARGDVRLMTSGSAVGVRVVRAAGACAEDLLELARQ